MKNAMVYPRNMILSRDRYNGPQELLWFSGFPFLSLTSALPNIGPNTLSTSSDSVICSTCWDTLNHFSSFIMLDQSKLYILLNLSQPTSGWFGTLFALLYSNQALKSQLSNWKWIERDIGWNENFKWIIQVNSRNIYLLLNCGWVHNVQFNYGWNLLLFW